MQQTLLIPIYVFGYKPAQPPTVRPLLSLPLLPQAKIKVNSLVTSIRKF